MTVAKSLFELQELDLQLDKFAKSIAQIDAELKGSKALIVAKAELAKRQKALQDLQAQQKTAELDAADAKERVTTVEGRMMGNQATARELPALQKEVTNLKGRLKGAEEQVVAAMERVEKAKKAADEQATVVKAEETKWAEQQKKLAEDRQKFAAEVPGVRSQRDDFAKEIADQAKAAYQSIRTKKGGVGVSKVQGGICSGCRITLPTTLVQRARAGKELVYCGNCGRILYVP